MFARFEPLWNSYRPGWGLVWVCGVWGFLERQTVYLEHTGYGWWLSVCEGIDGAQDTGPADNGLGYTDPLRRLRGWWNQD